MKRLALVALAACGGAPRFLGERLPNACSSSYSECEAQLQVVGLRDGFSIDDRQLDSYVDAVGLRIAKASTLDYVPRIIVMPVGSAAVMGRNIIIGRAMIVKLGSESELAGILAHETAHLEAGNNETSYIGNAVDEEGLADERAVELLVRANYPADAMSKALERLVSDGDDPLHPPMKTRVQRTHMLAELTGAPPRDEQRAAFLHVIEGRIVGWIRERGIRGQRAWIVADRGIVVPIPTGVEDSGNDDNLRVWHDRVRYGAWRLGPRAGVEAIDAMVGVEHEELAVGPVTIGVGPPEHDAPDGSLAQLLDSQRERVGKVDSDEAGAVIDTPRGPLLVTVKGPNNLALLRAWLPQLRRPTAAERELATSQRVKLVTAARTATVRELAANCVDARVALGLDDPDRTIRAGEAFKCTDR